MSKSCSRSASSTISPALQDEHAVADRPDDGEVVRDEQHRHRGRAPQLGEQLENARLHGDVERRGDLVADEKLRLGGERAGDRDSLFLAAAELPRHAVHDGCREVNLLEELSDARGLVGSREVEELAERAPDDPPDGHVRG